jgi:hypothetical protein
VLNDIITNDYHLNLDEELKNLGITELFLIDAVKERRYTPELAKKLNQVINLCRKGDDDFRQTGCSYWTNPDIGLRLQEIFFKDSHSPETKKAVLQDLYQLIWASLAPKPGIYSTKDGLGGYSGITLFFCSYQNELDIPFETFMMEWQKKFEAASTPPNET